MPTVAQPQQQMVQQPTPKDALRAVLADPLVADSIAKTCGKRQEMFVASLMEIFTQDGKLRQCDPRYVVAEALKTVTLGLPLNRQLGFAYLIPFNETVKDANGNKVYERDASGNVVTYSSGKPKFLQRMTPHMVIGYKGYIQMALRTGLYKTINTDVVCEGQYRSRDFLTGTFDFNGDKTSNRPIGYFAYIELTTGFSKTLYMTLEDVCSYAKLYGNGISFDTTEKDLMQIALTQVSSGATGIGWKGDFESMALKTVLRRLLVNYGIITTEMATALSSDSDYNNTGVESNGGSGKVITLDANSYRVESADNAQQRPAQAAPMQQSQQPAAPPVDGPGF